MMALGRGSCRINQHLGNRGLSFMLLTAQLFIVAATKGNKDFFDTEFESRVENHTAYSPLPEIGSRARISEKINDGEGYSSNINASQNTTSNSSIENIKYISKYSNHHVIHQENCTIDFRLEEECPCSGPKINCHENCIVQIKGSNPQYLGQISNKSDITAVTFCENEMNSLNINELSNFKIIESLDFSVNNIQEMDLSEIQLPYLKKINGSFNILTTFASQPFQIASLYLNDNRISNISFISIINNLTILNLSNNNISTIASNTFGNLTALKCLYLANNKIIGVNFMPDISNNIFSIDLGKNNIVNMSNIRDKHDLKVLNLNFNNITKINFYLFPKYIHLLNISNNQVSIIQNEDILNHGYLHIIDIRNNYIKKPTFIHHTGHSLEELYFSNNKLVNFKETSFKYIENVLLIDLSNTNLTSIETISNLVKLKELKIDKNNVTRIPRNIFNNTQLECLHIAENPLGKLICPASEHHFIILKECETVFENKDGKIVIDLYMRNESINKDMDCILQSKEGEGRYFLSNCESSSDEKKSASFPFLLVMCIVILMM